MKKIAWSGIAAVLLLTFGPGQARAEEMSPACKEAVRKGLNWMANQQQSDGHWEAPGGQYPLTMTSLGGMVMLMEGSTLREGKYSERIRKTVNWLMARGQPNGLISNPSNPGEAGRYMYGHGFAMLFLSSVYGDEDDADKRKKLEDILTRGVLFSGKAQTSRGGWGYVSAADGGGFDEGSVTITQLQGLRAARNAGIPVPVAIINNAKKYLRDCTNAQGGVIYTLGGGGGGDGRPALTAAAIACGFSAGEYNSEYIKRWIRFCQNQPGMALGGMARFGHDEYTHYYFAQALYCLGDNGYAKLFPDSKEQDRLTWTKYKKANFDSLLRSQSADGSWQGGQVGPVFISAVYLTILQLDNATLPIYQR